MYERLCKEGQNIVDYTVRVYENQQRQCICMTELDFESKVADKRACTKLK